MTKRKDQNTRAQEKDELKREVKEYNSNKTKAKISIRKEEIDNSGIILTKKQLELYKAIRNNTLTIVQGPAGTSKTFTACYTALALLAERKVSKIVITKPLQVSGEEIGILPGNIDEKVSPFMASYISNFEKIIGAKTLSFLLLNGDIVIQPLAYMRGLTFTDSIVLLDEAQNCTMKQIMLWVSRLGGGIDGKESKAVLMGDISQYDIKRKDAKMLDFIEMIDGIDGVYNFKFTSEDIVRNKILVEIVNRYEKYKNNHSDL
jgi:phosphate starvation-inducible protein PhoH and related proteins